MTTEPPTRTRILDAAHALVLEHGFAATTVDAVLQRADASKGAFFHHFPSKADLGTALIDRYATVDAEILDRFLASAEASTDDPAEQVVAFVRGFEEAVDEMALTQPGCLFVSFIYEQLPDLGPAHARIVESIELWRSRILAKLEAAATVHPPATEVDLPSLADTVFTTFEGAFILARATGDLTAVRRQLAHLRTYLELLFGVGPASSFGRWT